MEKKLEPKNVKAKAMEEEKTQKYSYDELNNICVQLHAQNQKLLQQLRQIDQAFVFRRMDWLLKAVELSDKIKDAEFINYCVGEIKEGIVLPEEETEQSK